MRRMRRRVSRTGCAFHKDQNQMPKSNAKINSSSTYLIVVLVMALVHLEMLLAVLVMMSAVRLADDHQN